MNTPDTELVKTYLLELQSRIVGALQGLDSKAVSRADQWDRPEGGGGISRVLEGGAVFEKGGINRFVLPDIVGAAIVKKKVKSIRIEHAASSIRSGCQKNDMVTIRFVMQRSIGKT